MAPRWRQTGWRLPLRVWGGHIEAWLEEERDQLPLWLPVALGGGIAAWFLLAGTAAWAGFILAMLGIAGACAIAPGGGRLARAGLWLALMAALGCGVVWLRSEQVRAPRLDRPTVAIFTGVVEAVEPQPAREAVRVRLATDGAALPPHVRVNVADKDMPAGLQAGARVVVRARLMPPAPAATISRASHGSRGSAPPDARWSRCVSLIRARAAAASGNGSAGCATAFPAISSHRPQGRRGRSPAPS